MVPVPRNENASNIMHANMLSGARMRKDKPEENKTELDMLNMSRDSSFQIKSIRISYLKPRCFS